MDQAEQLRSLIKKRRQNAVDVRAGTMRVISVTSGKGGVGKSNFVINLAIYLMRAKKRVILIDGDFGLANVELLLGVSPNYSFRNVLAGEVSVQDALATGPEDLKFLSGGSGLFQLSDISESQVDVLLESFSRLEEIADILLIDTGAGMSRTVTNLLRASSEIIIVTTSDPTAITDAYAVIKAMSEDNIEKPQLKMVVNRVESLKEGKDVFERLSRVSERFLNIHPVNLGYIPYDKNLIKAVKAQEPVALMFPNSESSRSMEAITKRLLDVPVEEPKGISNFISKWIRLTRDQ